jgi:hypothetical protein
LFFARLNPCKIRLVKLYSPIFNSGNQRQDTSSRKEIEDANDNFQELMHEHEEPNNNFTLRLGRDKLTDVKMERFHELDLTALCSAANLHAI